MTTTYQARSITIHPNIVTALHLTGRVVTVDGRRQGKVATIEGYDWTTVVCPFTGHVTLDYNSTPLNSRRTPMACVRYTWVDTFSGLHHVNTCHEWVPMADLKPGVCLNKKW